MTKTNDAGIKHTLVYYGWFEHGYRVFHANQTRYWTKDDTLPSEGKLVQFPNEDDFAGIRFGFFETLGKEYVYVSADAIVLAHPVLHVPERHGVAAPGPRFPNIENEAAAAILVDMISFNPGFRDALARKLRTLALQPL